MNRFFKMSFGLACVAAAFYFCSSENEEVYGLASYNIEALASGEGGNVACVGSGSVDCSGFKVKYKVSGYSLDNE